MLVGQSVETSRVNIIVYHSRRDVISLSESLALAEQQDKSPRGAQTLAAADDNLASAEADETMMLVFTQTAGSKA